MAKQSTTNVEKSGPFCGSPNCVFRTIRVQQEEIAAMFHRHPISDEFGQLFEAVVKIQEFALKSARKQREINDDKRAQEAANEAKFRLIEERFNQLEKDIENIQKQFQKQYVQSSEEKIARSLDETGNATAKNVSNYQNQSIECVPETNDKQVNPDDKFNATALLDESFLLNSESDDVYLLLDKIEKPSNSDANKVPTVKQTNNKTPTAPSSSNQSIIGGVRNGSRSTSIDCSKMASFNNLMTDFRGSGNVADSGGHFSQATSAQYCDSELKQKRKHEETIRTQPPPYDAINSAKRFGNNHNYVPPIYGAPRDVQFSAIQRSQSSAFQPLPTKQPQPPQLLQQPRQSPQQLQQAQQPQQRRQSPQQPQQSPQKLQQPPQSPQQPQQSPQQPQQPRQSPQQAQQPRQSPQQSQPPRQSPQQFQPPRQSPQQSQPPRQQPQQPQATFPPSLPANKPLKKITFKLPSTSSSALLAATAALPPLPPTYNQSNAFGNNRDKRLTASIHKIDGNFIANESIILDD